MFQPRLCNLQALARVTALEGSTRQAAALKHELQQLQVGVSVYSGLVFVLSV